jgi:hypothetical protein
MGSTTQDRKKGIHEDLQTRITLGKDSLIRQKMRILGEQVVRTSGIWECLSKESCQVLVRTSGKEWSVSATTLLTASMELTQPIMYSTEKKYVASNRAYYVTKKCLPANYYLDI